MSQSKLVLKGKRATITLDADSGGIWIQNNESMAMMCLVAGRDGKSPYVGIYGNQQRTFCDAALSVGSDGVAVLQTTMPDGTCKTISIPEVQSLLESQTEAPGLACSQPNPGVLPGV